MFGRRGGEGKGGRGGCCPGSASFPGRQRPLLPAEGIAAANAASLSCPARLPLARPPARKGPCSPRCPGCTLPSAAPRLQSVRTVVLTDPMSRPHTQHRRSQRAERPRLATETLSPQARNTDRASVLPTRTCAEGWQGPTHGFEDRVTTDDNRSFLPDTMPSPEQSKSVSLQAVPSGWTADPPLGACRVATATATRTRTGPRHPKVQDTERGPHLRTSVMVEHPCPDCRVGPIPRHFPTDTAGTCDVRVKGDPGTAAGDRAQAWRRPPHARCSCRMHGLVTRRLIP